MFSDWFVCAACVCTMLALSSATIYGQDLPPPATDFKPPLFSFESAKKKAMIWHVLALVFLLLAVATNDMLATSMPEISLNVPKVTSKNVSGFLHTVIIFAAKFVISKTQLTIIGADFLLGALFTIVHDRENTDLQQPYQDEAALAHFELTRPCQQPTFLDSIFGVKPNPRAPADGHHTTTPATMQTANPVGTPAASSTLAKQPHGSWPVVPSNHDL
eukprot:COSAG05_NODE_437_length_9835_cov_3.761915_3_plen_217_part_00